MDEKKIPFYKQLWFVIAAFIICAPVGLILLWANDRWSIKHRALSTAIIFGSVFAISGCCLLIAPFIEDSHQGQIQSPISSSSCRKKNFKEITSSFENAGFENVKTNPIYDIKIGLLKKEGAVESVTINGSSFNADDWFSPDAPVVVTYHASTTDDPEWIAEQEQEEKEREEAKKREEKQQKKLKKEAEERKKKELEERVYTSYSATELINDLNNNALVAKDKYDSQYVEVTGSLYSVDNDGKYFSIVGSNPYETIHCSISSDYRDEQIEILKTKSKGNTIVVKGLVSSVGEIIGYTINVDSIN